MTRPRLVTIAISHFCEEARWALDRVAASPAGAPTLRAYREERARRPAAGEEARR